MYQFDLNSPINFLVFTEASTSMSDDLSMPFDDHESGFDGGDNGLKVRFSYTLVL